MATSRAELKILQLELRLEPARLGLITNVLSVILNAIKNGKKIWMIHLLLM